MDKNGQINVGVLLVAFIGIIVATSLFLPIAQQVGRGTTTGTATNVTYTAPVAGASIDLNGQELIGTATVTNATNSTHGLINSNNFTITEGVSATTGVKTILYTSSAGTEYAGKNINITYVFGGDGYIESAGGRSVALLITIFSALAVAVVALAPALGSGLEKVLGK